MTKVEKVLPRFLMQLAELMEKAVREVKTADTRVNGKYYSPEVIHRRAVQDVWDAVGEALETDFRLVRDGRLVNKMPDDPNDWHKDLEKSEKKIALNSPAYRQAVARPLDKLRLSSELHEKLFEAVIASGRS